MVAESDSYGDWILVHNYEHYGGTNPEVKPQNDFPQLPSGRLSASDVENNASNGELAHVDNISRFGNWDADAVRLEGRTTGHSRQLKYFTTDTTVINSIVNDDVSAGHYDLKNQITKYSNHNTDLPDNTGSFSTTDNNSDRIFGHGFPMYGTSTNTNSNAHWAVRGLGDRWEMDDYPDGPQNSTIHRVWIRVASGVPKASSKERFFESDRVYMSGNNASIQNASDSASVTFSQIYEEPVVVAHTATNSGGQPVDDRVTNLTGSGCDIFAHEPDQQGHADNTHTYFVCESGVNEAEEGHRIEAGIHQTDTAFWDDTWDGNTVNFVNNWSSAPVVISTVNTHNNGLFATPAVSNVTADSFELSLLSEDNENTNVESIGWIAFPDAGAITIDGTPVESGVIDGGSVTFSQSFSTKPDYVADNMGHDGTSAWVRGSNWSSTDISWYDESGGLPYPYGYIAIQADSVVQGYDVAANGNGTFTYSSDHAHNYFDEVGGFQSDVSLQGAIDGFKRTVGYFDASANDGYEDIFTGHFHTSDFGGSGAGNFVYLSFAAKWSGFPSWETDDSEAEWIRKPAPDPNSYQLYVLRSDGVDDSRDEYYRLYYTPSSTETAYIADPFLWKGWDQDAPSDAQVIGSASNRTVIPSNRTEDEYSAYASSSSDTSAGHYSGVRTTIGTVYETPEVNPTSAGQITGNVATSLTATAVRANAATTDLGGAVGSVVNLIVDTTGANVTSQLSAGGTTATGDVVLDGILATQVPGDGTASTTSPASMCGSSTTTKQASASLTYDGPGNVTATVNSDTSITVNWTKTNSEADHYRVRMERDGTWADPASGNTTDASNTSLTVYHESDNPYETMVGADSEYRFAVKTVGSDTNSDYNGSGRVYTTPIPPHNPSVSRPDANTIDVTYTNKSDIAPHTSISIREDTGSGYGNWNEVAHFTSESTGTTYTRTLSVSNGDLVEDARYQVYVDHHLYNDNDNDGSNERNNSEISYADYGNQENVYFSDSFESGDFSAWDSTNLGDNKTYVSTSLDGYNGNGRVADSDPPDGSYGAQLAGGDWIQENLGDLSNESDVLVKAYIQVGSLDDTGENVRILWYDGSSWQTLESWSAEQNKQGWIEVTSLVPSSYLSTDNRVRFDGYGGSGDFLCVDRVVVSDILHEYTKPAAPTNPSTEEGFNELTFDWTPEDSFAGDEVFTREGTSGGFTKRFHGPPWTWTGLKNDQTYEWYPSAVLHQDRNGSIESWPRTNGPTSTATTLNAQTSSVSTTSSDALSRLGSVSAGADSAGAVETSSTTPSGSLGDTASAGGFVEQSTATPSAGGASTSVSGVGSRPSATGQPITASGQTATDGTGGPAVATSNTIQPTTLIDIRSSTVTTATSMQSGVGSASTSAGGQVATSSSQEIGSTTTTASAAVVVSDGMLASPVRGGGSASSDTVGAVASAETTTINSGFSAATSESSVTGTSVEQTLAEGTSLVFFTAEQTVVNPKPVAATGFTDTGAGGSTTETTTQTGGNSESSGFSQTPPTATAATPSAGGGKAIATDGGSVVASATPSGSSAGASSAGGEITTAESPTIGASVETTATTEGTETAAATSRFGADGTTATVSISSKDTVLTTPKIPSESESATYAEAETSSLVSLGKYIDPKTAVNTDIEAVAVDTLVIPASVFSRGIAGSTTDAPLNAIESPAYTTTYASGFTSAITWTLLAPATSASGAAGETQSVTSLTYDGTVTATSSGGTTVTFLSEILEGDGPLLHTPGIYESVRTDFDNDSQITEVDLTEQVTSFAGGVRLSLVIDDVTTDYEHNE